MIEPLPLIWRQGFAGHLLESGVFGFEPQHRITLDRVSIELGERSFLAMVELGCELVELLEDVADGVGLSRRLVLGDELGDLFEFDDVGPVGDDPVAALVLSAGCRGQEVVHLVGVELGVHDPVDELLLVGWRCVEELFELKSAAGEFNRAARRDRRDGRRLVCGEPDSVFEESEHEVVPPTAGVRFVWSGSDAWFVVDVVQEAVFGDAGGGVVPDGCTGGGGGSGTDPGGEPCGRFGSELKGGTVDGGVECSPVEGRVTGTDATIGECIGPFVLGRLDDRLSLGERVDAGSGGSDWVGVVNGEIVRNETPSSCSAPDVGADLWPNRRISKLN